mgnify:FL=1
MLLTLEKILILKTVPLFKDIPEPALADFISSAEELAAVEGADLLNVNDEWSDMYVVLQGRLRVHKDGKTLKELGNTSVLGVLYALDPAVSGVAVSVLEDTTLFRVPSETLYQLMSEHKSLEKAIIGSLCGQLRDLSGDTPLF